MKTDYIPTEEDLKDFEEFAIEREKLSDNKKITFVYVTRNNEKIKTTKNALLDTLTANISTVKGIMDRSLLERLNIVELFGYNKKQILKVMDPDLSEEDIVRILKGKTYPYLLRGLNTYFNDDRITRSIIARNNSVLNRTLSYIPFNEVVIVSDRKAMYDRFLLIKQTPYDNRPMYWLRTYILTKYNNRKGFWDVDPTDTKTTFTVRGKKFLTVLLYELQNFPDFLKYQFGTTTTKYALNDKQTVRFSIPLVMIEHIEEYFNLDFVFDRSFKDLNCFMTTVKRNEYTIAMPFGL